MLGSSGRERNPNRCLAIGGRAIGHNIRGEVPGTVALAGYDGTGDHFEHVIAASEDGTLHELFWGSDHKSASDNAKR